MRRSLLLYLLLLSVFALGIAHYLALEFYLYWQYTWFDMPMHILGGIIIAFSVLVLPSFGLRIKTEYLLFMPVLFVVLVVGLLWELFEIWIGVPLFDVDFERDIVKDLIMDLLGGGVGYFVGSEIRKLEHV